MILRSKQYQRGPCRQLPSLTENFVGREHELAMLCQSIRARAKRDKPTAIICAIAGGGGVGKSALAIAAGYTLLNDCPDAQIVLHLGAHSANPSTPTLVRDVLLRATQGESPLPNDEDALWMLYRSVFRDEEKGICRALLILDDVRDDSDVQALLPPPGCIVLLTSRRQLESGEPLRLECLPRSDSLKLLCQFRSGLTETEAGELAQLCGDLPVALRVAGGFLKRYRSKPVAEYVAELRTDPLARLRHEDESLDINVIFGRSLRDLTSSQQTAFARLSVLPAECDRDAARAVANCSGNDLDELVALHLLDFDELSGRYHWHDLVRAYAVRQLNDHEARATRRRHAEHFTQVADRSQKLYLTKGDKTGLEVFDRECRHFISAFEFLHQTKGMNRQVIALVNAVAYASEIRFHPRERIRWQQAHLAAAREVGDRRAEAHALSNLGVSYFALGKAIKAIEFHEKAQRIDHEIGNFTGETSNAINLGNAYLVLGNANKAAQLFEHLLNAGRIGDPRTRVNTLGGLGLAYDDLREPHKAIEAYERSLKLAREIGYRQGEGNALGNLGVVYKNLGDIRKGIDFFNQSLRVAEEIGDRRGKGNALGSLGQAYAALGEWQKAIDFYKQRLVISREIGDRRGEATGLFNAAAAMHSLGRITEAISYAEAALRICEAIRDPRSIQMRAALAEWRAK